MQYIEGGGKNAKLTFNQHALEIQILVTGLHKIKIQFALNEPNTKNFTDFLNNYKRCCSTINYVIVFCCMSSCIYNIIDRNYSRSANSRL